MAIYVTQELLERSRPAIRLVKQPSSRGGTLADRSVRNALKPLRIVLATARREGAITHNPASEAVLPHRERIEEDEDRPRPFPFEMMELVVSLIHADHRTMFELLAATGVRRPRQRWESLAILAIAQLMVELGGALTELLDWRTVMYVNVGFAAVDVSGRAPPPAQPAPRRGQGSTFPACSPSPHRPRRRDTLGVTTE
jgi:hypothetical protein